MIAKISLFALSLIVGSSAFAASYKCDGRELFIGGSRDGKVSVDVAGVSASFAADGEEDSTVISTSSVCGANVSGCVVSNRNGSNVEGRKVVCEGGGIRAVGFLAMSTTGLNGRAECESPATRKVLEFSNCTEQ